jgi:hypothetical protein
MITETQVKHNFVEKAKDDMVAEVVKALNHPDFKSLTVIRLRYPDVNYEVTVTLATKL